MDFIENDEEENELKEVYDSLILEDDCYPKFGIRERGPLHNDEDLENYFIKFTSKFPLKTFIFYYFGFDAEFCTVFTIKDNEIQDKKDKDLTNLSFPIDKHTLFVSCDIRNVTINHNITIIFNKNYFYDYAEYLI